MLLWCTKETWWSSEVLSLYLCIQSFLHISPGNRNKSAQNYKIIYIYVVQIQCNFSISGKDNDENALSSVEVYSVEEDRWTECSNPLSSAHPSPTAVVVNRTALKASNVDMCNPMWLHVCIADLVYSSCAISVINYMYLYTRMHLFVQQVVYNLILM